MRLYRKFPVVLFFILLLTFCIHFIVLSELNINWPELLIIQAYIVNLIFALGVYYGLLRLKEKYSSSLGFIFMGGSLLKFLIFFIVFYPKYQADDIMGKAEFASFFIPYAICLILEVKFLILHLNNVDVVEK